MRNAGGELESGGGERCGSDESDRRLVVMGDGKWGCKERLRKAVIVLHRISSIHAFFPNHNSLIEVLHDEL